MEHYGIRSHISDRQTITVFVSTLKWEKYFQHYSAMDLVDVLIFREYQIPPPPCPLIFAIYFITHNITVMF